MEGKKQNLSDYQPENVPSAANMRMGIIVSEWNFEITGSLLKGATETLIRHGMQPDQLVVYYVPGSFELPLAASWLIEQMKPDAVICLGCVIQGETRHFEFISHAVSQGITNLGLKTKVPVVFGVLTPDTIEQARDRAGGRYGNKGDEAAITAIKMAALKRSMYA